jgi:hypothetical protein
MQFARRLFVSIRPALAFVAMIVLATQAKGCAPAGPPGSNSETIHSCSPNYIDENAHGRLAVQQRGPGSYIAWGVYPAKQTAARYVIKVYVDAKVRDPKDQDYPPHGSLPYKNRKGQIQYRSGQIFKIVGNSYDAKGNKMQAFFIKCRLA